jgi:hypothetical protein
MAVDIYGHTHEHLHSPCAVCGYATRYKQWGPIRCLCSEPQYAPVEDIWAEQD